MKRSTDTRVPAQESSPDDKVAVPRHIPPTSPALRRAHLTLVRFVLDWSPCNAPPHMSGQMHAEGRALLRALFTVCSLFTPVRTRMWANR